MDKNIRNLLDNIKTAVFGKDVRNSIHDAIEACYEDASKNGNANMEVTIARGEYDTLNERLNGDLKNEQKIRAEKDNELHQEIKQGLEEISTGTPLVASSIDGMTDTSRIYVNTEDKNWYYYNGELWVSGGIYQSEVIEKNSITLRELNTELNSQLSKEKDIFLNLKVSSHYRIEDGKAVENTSAPSYSSVELDVKAGEIYKIIAKESSNKAYGYIFVDDDYNVISYGMQGSGQEKIHEETVIVPNNAKKLLSSILNPPGVINIQIFKVETKDINLEFKKISSMLNFEIIPISLTKGTHYRIVDGKAVENTSTPSYSSVVLDVKPGEIYKVISSIASRNTRGYMLVDESMNVLDYDFGPDMKNSDFAIIHESIITIPEQVKKLILNTRNLSQDKYGIEKVKEDNIKGKNISIIGDSISTKVNRNAYEIVIDEKDVGIELKAYLTYYDVQNELSIGGHKFTNDEIGTEVTFIPTDADIGKCIGMAANYNGKEIITWWENLEKNKKCIVNPVCWSGSSITSHEKNKDTYETSYSWHDAQIRKAGIRVPGTMNRIAPDYIIIYRGTNDFSHAPYTILSDNIFENCNFTVPENDFLNTNQYGYKEALVLLISKLRSAYPTSKIYVCTLNVFKRVNCAHFPTNNGINSLPQYNNAIREVCNFMGVGIIELDKDGITFENCYNEGYITDSESTPTHPSNKGHIKIYEQVLKDLY